MSEAAPKNAAVITLWENEVIKDETKIHTYNIQVYIEDTDAYQVVYHPNYLKYAERARSDFLKAMGVLKSQLHTEHKLRIVVSKLEIEYLSPAFLDDQLVVATSLFDASKAVITLRQDISRFSTILAKVLVKLAIINEQMKPVRWPLFLQEQLSFYK